MTERLIDYGLVAIVVVAVAGLFRISRILMKRLLNRVEARCRLTADLVLRMGFLLLLAGLLMLPFITSLLAFINTSHLPGGMPFHLVMVAVSIVLFSISEDLFRSFRSYPREPDWTAGRHFLFISIPLAVFWAVGCLLLSPLFYSGLSIILAVFYLYAIRCLPTVTSQQG